MVFYRKIYFPLESNPEVFTTLSRKLGVGTSLVFRDVISLDVLPHPTLALILAFPTSNMYEIQRELKISHIKSTGVVVTMKTLHGSNKRLIMRADFMHCSMPSATAMQKTS